MKMKNLISPIVVFTIVLTSSVLSLPIHGLAATTVPPTGGPIVPEDVFKLSNGSFGTLLVSSYHNSQSWGTVCSDGMKTQEIANLVCKQMGFSGGNFTATWDIYPYYSVNDPLPTYFDDAECPPGATSLNDCEWKYTQGDGDCTHE